MGFSVLEVLLTQRYLLLIETFSFVFTISSLLRNLQ